MINAAFRHKISTPRFEILVRADTPAERGASTAIRTYRVVRVIYDHEHCFAITDNGVRFTVVGAAVSKMKPGFVFQARTAPLASWSVMHPQHRAIWLVERP